MTHTQAIFTESTMKSCDDLHSLANTKAASKLDVVPKAIPVSVELPPVKSRWCAFWASETMMEYHRLFTLVILVNVALLGYGLTNGQWWQSASQTLPILADIVLANFAIGILIRQHYVVNLLFWLATRAPVSWPIAIRRRLGKVYHFGGLHSAGATAGSLWYVAFLGTAVWSWNQGSSEVSMLSLQISAVLMLMLVGIISLALPQVRSRFHNQFELMHRLGGWSALLLFWAQFLSFTYDSSQAGAFASNIFSAPGFWLLTLITTSVALPWLRLKKVPVELVKPSNHVALAKFDYGVTPFAGSSTALSRSPLTEWHSFANVPSPDSPGFRLTISRAGDWTGQFIDDLPSHVWVKAIPTAGVGNIDQLFKRVVWVATGSGIGPCLPHLLAGETPSKLVWSTRTPRKTYGDDLMDEILSVQPDAIIWDTTENGKPDMVELAWRAYQEFDAEAVICIANQKLTWQVVTGLESRGIPAYGAIWDS